jgi:hypothetical protein
MCKRAGALSTGYFTASGCYGTAEIFGNPAKIQLFGGRQRGKRWDFGWPAILVQEKISVC